MIKLIRIVNKFFWYLIARCFYAKKYCQTGRISPRTLAAYGFMQRIVGFNKSVPWSVHDASVVSSWKHIQLDGHPPFSSYSNKQCIQARIGRIFGRNVILAPGAVIVSANYNEDPYARHIPTKPIEIGANTRIGESADILPGVRIGKHVVAAAGAILTKDIEGDCVVAGSPAKPIKHFGPCGGAGAEVEPL